MLQRLVSEKEIEIHALIHTYTPTHRMGIMSVAQPAIQKAGFGRPVPKSTYLLSYLGF